MLYLDADFADYAEKEGKICTSSGTYAKDN
jgi:hypothetical protein